MIRITFIIAFVLLSIYTNAQAADKTVSITVSGSGKTQDEAKQSALRSAIEQAFGAFISSKTEIFNDQVVAEQIASVSSGNIQSFKVLNEAQLPNGSLGVTLKAMVSVSKLTSFVEAKGIAIEIKGGLFAINIKQQMLNEQSEVEAVSEMVGLLHEPMQTAFDYSIKSGEPKSIDAQNKNWEIPLEVTATANKNMDFCANYFIKTLTALSLTDNEVKSYQSLNKAIFPVTINYQGFKKTIFLRKQRSLDALFTLASQWQFYTSLFLVKTFSDLIKVSGESLWKYESIDLPQGTSFPTGTSLNSFPASNLECEINIFKFHETKNAKNDPYGRSQNGEDIIFDFPKIGQETAKFSWQDDRTLAQIEKMTGYEINPIGIISQFKHGGYVVYEKNGHGLVSAIIDLGRFKWEESLEQFKQFKFNGYSDWRLPNIDELDQLSKNLNRYGIGNFNKLKFWSSSEKIGSIYILDFYDGQKHLIKSTYYNKILDDETAKIRPVRSF